VVAPDLYRRGDCWSLPALTQLISRFCYNGHAPSITLAVSQPSTLPLVSCLSQSSGLDPLVGIFTGVLAYYLYETHPRTSLPENQRLMPLVKQKYYQWVDQREAKLKEQEGAEGPVDWRSLVGDEGPNHTKD
jgi:hypothetical protein